MFKPRKVGWLDWGRRGLHEGGGNCLKYLKRGWNRKDGRGNKDLKEGGLEPPYIHAYIYIYICTCIYIIYILWIFLTKTTIIGHYKVFHGLIPMMDHMDWRIPSEDWN